MKNTAISVSSSIRDNGLMNILFISVSAPPKSGAESLQAAKYLRHLSANANITLVTTHTASGGWKKKDDSQVQFLQNISQLIELPSINNFNGLKGFVARKIFKRWLRRPDTDFLFHWQANKVTAGLNTMPDIIYSRSTPFSSALLALKLKNKLNKAWVMHLSDPWSDSPYGNYNNEYNRIAEEKCFAAADLISFTTPETQDYYSEKYPHLQKKFFIAPNVFEKEEINDTPELFVNAKLTFLHSGNLYKQRNLKCLLDPLQKLEKNELKAIEIQLAGHLDEYNLDLIKESGLNCIKILGPLTAAHSYLCQRKADILISIDKPREQKIDEVFLPSKIQDYVAARKIILAITSTGSATHRVVQDHFGYCFEPGDKKITSFLQNAIRAYKNKDEEFFRVKERGEEFEATRNAANVAERFKEAISGEKK
jgi:glycosyltransferase involved in cell wall biosynthesis